MKTIDLLKTIAKAFFKGVSYAALVIFGMISIAAFIMLIRDFFVRVIL